MLKRMFYYKPSTIKVLALLVAIPPLALIIMTFGTAMSWRVLANTSYYKVGHLVSGVLTLVVLTTFLVLLRFTWNAACEKNIFIRIASVAATLFLLFFYISLPNFLPPLKRLIDDFFGKVYYLGEVTPESFVKLKNKIDNNLFPPQKIIIGSGGGNAYAGLAIGHLIREYQLDIEVLENCSSSCANYLFPAGRKKVLNKHSIVMYHGNTLQKSMVTFSRELENALGDPTKLPLDTILGKQGKEMSITFEENSNEPNSDATKAVFSYLGWQSAKTFADVNRAFINEEKRFYKELGVDHRIGIYGQIGEYESLYQSYQYDGFYYSIEDMNKMGIGNIHVKNSPWQPELNSFSKRFYKVSL